MMTLPIHQTVRFIFARCIYGVKIVYFTYALDSTGHLLIVRSNIFFIAIFVLNIIKLSGAFLLFHQNTQDIFLLGSFVSGVSFILFIKIGLFQLFLDGKLSSRDHQQLDYYILYVNQCTMLYMHITMVY